MVVPRAGNPAPLRASTPITPATATPTATPTTRGQYMATGASQINHLTGQPEYGLTQSPNGNWYKPGEGEIWGSSGGPASPLPDHLRVIGDAQRDQRQYWSDLANIYGSQAGPQLASLGYQNAYLNQMMGLVGAGQAVDQRWMAQQRGLLGAQAGLNNQGMQITLDDIGRRRGFAGTDRDISFEDIGARRGFAGTDRDLTRQMIDTDRTRLQEQRDMDRALLDSEQIAMGAFGSNMAQYKRSFMDQMLGLDLTDRDTAWSRNDLDYDKAMRGLLTEEQRAALGYDSTMSGLLTAEQRARLERDAGNLGLQRQSSDLTRQFEQGNIGAARDMFGIMMQQAQTPLQQMQVMQSIQAQMASSGIPAEFIESVMGDVYSEYFPQETTQPTSTLPANWRQMLR